MYSIKVKHRFQIYHFKFGKSEKYKFKLNRISFTLIYRSKYFNYLFLKNSILKYFLTSSLCRLNILFAILGIILCLILIGVILGLIPVFILAQQSDSSSKTFKFICFYFWLFIFFYVSDSNPTTPKSSIPFNLNTTLPTKSSSQISRIFF